MRDAGCRRKLKDSEALPGSEIESEFCGGALS